jgi:hypothetical protein
MGYFSKSAIANITTPHIVSLAGVSNFLELQCKQDFSHTNTPTAISLRVRNTNYTDANIANTQFTVTELYGKANDHLFRGTLKPDEVNEQTFLLVADPSIVAENIRTCLLKNSFFRSRFNITVPFAAIDANNTMTTGSTIHIQSLGMGDPYRFDISYDSDFLERDGDSTLGDNNDMIDYGRGNVDIEADVYVDTGIMLGQDDKPQTATSLGKHLATMSKSYFGQPIWFDVNALMNSYKAYSHQFLYASDASPWTDAGTMINFRLMLKTFDGKSRNVFYASNVLYALTGYARTLNKVDMNEYVYAYPSLEERIIKPLTNQPLLPHVQGQSQYFNFIFKDTKRGLGLGNNEYRFGIRYKMYTASGKYIDSINSATHTQQRTTFGMVNTTRLNIDWAIEQTELRHKATVGLVEAYLCRNHDIVSHPLRLSILPSCGHRIHDFAFLNALGGWSSFNFAGDRSVTVRSEANIGYHNQLPRYTISHQIEGVLDKDIKESFSVKTSPITAEVADWLRELTASIAVYELATKRYVVIDDFDIKHNTSDDLFTLEMKYHYSDTYNGSVK